MRHSKKPPVLKVILIVWIIFASLYVVYGEYTRLNVLVAKRAYNSGLRDAVNQLIDEAQSCQPIPVTSGDRRVDLISLECLKPPAENAESAEQ